MSTCTLRKYVNLLETLDGTKHDRDQGRWHSTASDDSRDVSAQKHGDLQRDVCLRDSLDGFFPLGGLALNLVMPREKVDDRLRSIEVAKVVSPGHDR